MDEVLKAIWPVFRAEAAEHVGQLTAEVLKLELPAAKRPPGLLESIGRTAHSLKGSSASLGFHSVEQVAHAIEDVLQAGEKSGNFRVDDILFGLEAIDRALGRGDGGEPVEVAELEQVLRRLGATPSAATTEETTQGAPTAEITPALPPLAPTDPALVAELWPVFRTEIVEQLALFETGLAELKRNEGKADPAREEVGRLGLAAGQLRASFAMLTLSALERLAGVLADALEQERSQEQLSGARLETFFRTAHAFREGIAGVDGGKSAAITNLAERLAELRDPGTVRRTQQPSAETTFSTEAAHELIELEEALAQLRSPNLKKRGEVLKDAARRAHNLKGSAGAVGQKEVSALAQKLQEVFKDLEKPAERGPILLARLAGLLVDLRPIVDRMAERAANQPLATPTPPKPLPHAPPPDAPAENAAAAAVGAATVGRAADRSIRVSERTLDSLALQVEDLALSVGFQDRRARELRSVGGRVAETLQLLERYDLAARTAGDKSSRAELEESVSRLRSLKRDMTSLATDAARDVDHLRMVSSVVRNDLRDLRMIPASSVLDPLQRAVRDVAQRVGKEVALTTAGGEVRLDRRIVDEIKDPLVHLVRNAIDHGLESSAARVAAGKELIGNVAVRVEQRGHRVAVIVEDDGAGLALERIRATAIKRGLLNPEEAAALDDDQTARLIFRPGFSTAEQISAISGRGVGLDVVQETVTRLQGHVGLHYVVGKGTRFTLELPLTLAAALVLVVETSHEQIAIPSETVARILRLKREELGTVAGRAMLQVNGQQLPYASMAQAVGLTQIAATHDGEIQQALHLQAEGQEAILAVDELVGHHEVVVQPLGTLLASSQHLVGAAVLDGGRVVAVANVPELLRRAQPAGRSRSERTRTRILVADDSLTTRSAMKAVLEIAGYTVVAAKDGEEAFRLLQETPCQLVVTDVQMPRLDGIGLTQRVRADPSLAQIPIILVTSLDSPEDRAAGLAVGADGYLVKREVERGGLLDLVRQLIPS